MRNLRAFQMNTTTRRLSHHPWLPLPRIAMQIAAACR
jgi:hypothetical protein